MLDRHDEPLELGGLWRDVLNVLGDRPITPDVYRPLGDAVLPKWAKWTKWTYFLGHAARKLTDDREELEADIARARIGWRIWTEQLEDLRTFATKVANHPVDDEQLESWWIDDARGESAGWDAYSVHEKKITGQFQRLLRLSDEDDRTLRYHPYGRNDPYLDGWHLGWLHSNLTWTGDLSSSGDSRGRPGR
jgi:hypothetical protein